MHKKKIKVSFHNFWNGFRGINAFLKRHPYLERFYRLEEADCEAADISIIGPYPFKMGKNVEEIEIPKHAKKTLLYSAEVLSGDFSKFDYTLGYYISESDVNLYLPCWVPRLYANRLSPSILLSKNRPSIGEDEIAARKFCNYIYRNKVPMRENIYTILSNFFPIDAPGLSCNNSEPIARRVPDKIEYQSNYLFSIAVENQTVRKYHTEKIIESFIARTIPIYYGDDIITDLFNENSFLLIRNIKDIDKIANYALEIARNRYLLKSYYRESPFQNDSLPEYTKEEYALDFFDKIFA